MAKAHLIEFETARVQLRQWTKADRQPVAALNADPRVMEFLPEPLNRAQSDATASRCEALIDERGWGFWAAELNSTGRFIGFVGLHIPSAGLPFFPCVEVAWRLAFDHWGKASRRRPRQARSMSVLKHSACGKTCRSPPWATGAPAQ